MLRFIVAGFLSLATFTAVMASGSSTPAPKAADCCTPPGAECCFVGSACCK